MIDLERDLRDLGRHLDHPAGDRLAIELRARLAAPARPAAVRPIGAARLRRRRIVTGLASVAAVVLLAVAIPPSRDAIADILGLGSADGGRPEQVAEPHHDPTVTTGSPPPEVSVLDLDSARAAVDFPIKVPARLEVPAHVTVDRRVPGGLVELAYPSFTLVEVASPPDVAAELAKLVAPESRVRIVSVRERPGLWITGTHHEIAYLDREGVLRHGASRPTGHVLMWEEDGVTYRIEGLAQQTSASEMARTIT
jgi:hypothetical protein